MKAAVIQDFGGIDSVTVSEVSAPKPNPDQIVIKVHAAPVNYVDLLVIDGKYQFLPPLPFTPGKGPAGVVQSIGSEVKNFATGDRVLAMAEQGGYAEQAVVLASQCYRLPENMTFIEAGSMSLAYDTAWFALRDRARLCAGESVLVLGGSGAVGLAAIQLAKAMGARVFAGISRPEKRDAVLEAGADAAIDLSGENIRDLLRERVQAVNDGKNIDIILDPLGGDIFDAALRSLAWRGRLVIIGFAAGRIPIIKANYLLLKNIEVSGLQVSDYRKRLPDQVRRCYEELFAFYEEGKLRPQEAIAFPLARVKEALHSVQDRTATGRVVLVFES